MRNDCVEISAVEKVYDEEHCRRYLNFLDEAEAKEMREFAEWLENFFNWFPDYRIAHDGFCESGDTAFHLSPEPPASVANA